MKENLTEGFKFDAPTKVPGFLSRWFVGKILRFRTKRRIIRREKIFKKLDDSQKLAYNIVKELLSDKFSTLSIAPISGTLFIKNDRIKDGGIFCRMEFQTIRIVDGIKGKDGNAYDIVMSPESMSELRYRFALKAEQKRMKTDKDIMDNIKNHLLSTYNNLKIKG